MQPPVYLPLDQQMPEGTRAASSRLPQDPRPETYYGEGPFDPPSSDDEDEALLDKDVMEDAERGDNVRPTLGKKDSWPSPLRMLLIILCGLVTLSGLIGIYAAWAYKGTGIGGSRHRAHITMDHVFNGTFSAQKQSLAWVPEAGDGVFSIWKDGNVTLFDLKTNETRNLVAQSDVKDEFGRELYWNQWKLSPDMKFLLLKADYQKQWRYSSFGNYYVHDLGTKETHPILPPSNPPLTAYATWSPTGESIAFVQENDLYLLLTAAPTERPIRVTNTGTPSFFNGVPDWVYEEEVFASDSTLWFSPSSTLLAFLSFDETKVDTFTYPVYNPTSDSYEVVPYTHDVKMKYPKPGYNNPIVSLHVFDISSYRSSAPAPTPSSVTITLDWDGRFDITDSIISEVTWVGNETLLVKETNRNADKGSIVLFDLSTRGRLATSVKGRIVRKLGKGGEEGDDGWIDHTQSIYPLPSSLSPGGGSAYLDVVPSKDGYDHIALFSPATSSKPIWLTKGEWEVTSGVLSIDARRRLVYFQAANPSSTERNIYSVSIPTTSASERAEPTPLTDHSAPSFYNADFSPQAGFYLLSYDGPNVPWQKVFKVNSTDFNFVLTGNQLLNETQARFDAPSIIYSTIVNEGYELNVKEIRPPRMDTSGRTKYPVLFRVYGGPGSQLVDVKFGVDWHHYLACSLQYIVVTVDGRGTGYKGRKLRNPVKGNLGFFETRDQIEAARIWADKPWVDRKRIGIWGWSYGGFMSSKVVEANAGIHSLAMAVAPVTSWRLYDSIYTERYMNLPSLNPSGYINASISNVTGFHKVDYLLAHGSGDDNVHFANSAHLLDMFTRDKVRNFRFRMFTDSNHNINRRGAFRELHEWLTEFLLEKWGKGGRRAG